MAAYPYGSKTIKSSFDRIPGYTKQVEELGVEIVPSIAELLESAREADATRIFIGSENRLFALSGSSVIAANDRVAFGVYGAAQERGGVHPR